MKVFIFLVVSLSFSLMAKDILFIGNSYTMQSRGTLEKLLKSEQVKWNMTHICKGGFTLEKHLKDDKNKSLIQSKKWDAIILQEQSQTPAYSNLRKGYLSALANIAKLNKKTQSPIYLFTSWGRRDGDKQNIKTSPTYEVMQKKLNEGFSEGKKKYKMKLLPIAGLWEKVRKENPELGRELYKNDGSHPSSKGAFLVALSLYCTIENLDPTKVEFSGDLNSQEAKQVKTLAGKIFK